MFKLGLVFTIAFALSAVGCAANDAPNLVPDEACTAPNYWCTWYWQNYKIKAGEPVVEPDAQKIYTNPAAREELDEETLLGPDGWARVLLPQTRGDYYFLIDHGWQDKSIKRNTFFSLVMEKGDFPSYADLEPKERIKRLNDEIKALGWRGLGLWVRGTPTKEEARKFVEWSKYAGIEYWKIDGGDTRDYWSFKAKQEIYPQLVLEYVTGAGPLNTRWDKPGLPEYPSVYEPGTNRARFALDVIRQSDVFRTYDAAPLLVTPVSMQRVHDILVQTAGKGEYIAHLNIQDDTQVAAALGCVVAVKRHPMNGSRMYKGEDLHFQIRGNRRVENRLNEMDRFVRWQRIAPPMVAGHGTYHHSEEFLVNKIVFRPGDTWFRASIGKMVHASAPAVMSRNIELPVVKAEGDKPHVMASRFPNGAVCVATEGRTRPDESWYHPRADVTLKVDDGVEPIGVFGHFKSLTLTLDKPVPAGVIVWAQDLKADRAIDITGKVTIGGHTVTLPGQLIDEVGTAKNDPGDISTPGLVLKIAK